MKNKFIDLHIHSIFSDGYLKPEEIVEKASRRNISAISITDHDNIDGLSSAIKESKKYNIEIIPGVELSAESSYSEEHEIHILGYFIDYNNEYLRKKLLLLRDARRTRAEKMMQKLNRLNIYLDTNSLLKSNSSIGRLHFANALVENGYVNNIHEAFKKFLSYGKPAYEPKLKLPPLEAIKLIEKSGGIPVLAHPYYTDYKHTNLIPELIEMGLRGIEVWHNKQPGYVTINLIKIAKKYNLLMTGGSDFHGNSSNENIEIGINKVPYRILFKLKERVNERNNTDIYG